jgi:hypothetical protein
MAETELDKLRELAQLEFRRREAPSRLDQAGVEGQVLGGAVVSWQPSVIHR